MVLTTEIQALQPSNETDYTDIVESSTAFTSLSPHQRAILKAMVDNFLLEIIETDAQIAEKVGCHPQTVLNARHSRVFQAAIREILPQLATVKSLDVAQKIYKWIDKDWKAGKYWHELAGVFIQRSQSLNIHANMTQTDQSSTVSDIIDEFLINLGASGYPIEKIVSRYHELRSEGAF